MYQQGGGVLKFSYWTVACSAARRAAQRSRRGLCASAEGPDATVRKSRVWVVGCEACEAADARVRGDGHQSVASVHLDAAGPHTEGLHQLHARARRRAAGGAMAAFVDNNDDFEHTLFACPAVRCFKVRRGGAQRARVRGSEARPRQGSCPLHAPALQARHACSVRTRALTPCSSRRPPRRWHWPCERPSCWRVRSSLFARHATRASAAAAPCPLCPLPLRTLPAHRCAASLAPVAPLGALSLSPGSALFMTPALRPARAWACCTAMA